MRRPWWLLLAAVAVFPGPARAEGSVRCGSRLVSVGDARIDLLARCGQPALRERRVEERWEGVTDGTVGQGRRVTAVIEDWTYDFGPRAFSHVVTLVNGRIERIDRGGYGYADGGPRPARMPRARCDAGMLREGDRKLDVLARCGEPAIAEAWDEARGTFAVADPGWTTVQAVTVRVEVWTYDLGPSRFVRFVRLENGEVTSVTTGTYGYAD